MSQVLTRMFAYLTLVSYLVVGTVAVRIFSSENASISVSANYLSVFTESKFASDEIAQLEMPEMKFDAIKFPVEKVSVVKKVVKISIPKIKVVTTQPVMVERKIEKNELPFHEPVILGKVQFDGSLPKALVALYVPAPEEIKEMVAAATIKDEVSTKVAKSEEIVVDEEPAFFEYPVEEPVAPNAAAAQPKAVAAEVAVEEKLEETVKEEVVNQIVDNSENLKAEDVQLDDLLTFDYSAAQKDIQTETTQKVSHVTTQSARPAKLPVTPTVKAPAAPIKKSVPTQAKEKQQGFTSALLDGGREYPAELNVQISGTDLKHTELVNNFEVRFQDDQSQILEDYGNGSVKLNENLAESSMTRSVVVLSPGFAPTNTDLLLEKGSFNETLPAIQQDVFNKLIGKFETKGPVGAVLVERDGETKAIEIDVAHGQVLHLDEEMRKTEKADYTYKLFVGVLAGNAMVEFTDYKGNSVSKIVHVHSRELTFVGNTYANTIHDSVTLKEEDLLSREKSPLIIPAGAVKPFATNKESVKVGDHTYKLDFENSLHGERKYIELTHQDESVFIGMRTNNTLDVPSEGFMRHILSRFENQKLGNRCLVQVNLTKKIENVEVGTESVENGLRVYTQYLDADGKFYTSTSEKTMKVIVVGENSGSIEFSQDGKINLKIMYQDGTTQYLGTYCSPNSYLVEQL